MEDLRHADIHEYETSPYKKRRRRFLDRREGRRVRTLPAMQYATSYIMKDRNDAMNFFEDAIDITNAELFLDRKHKEGYTDMTLLHVILAAYVRTLADRPGINRYIAGQRIYHRNSVQCVMTIKKEMSLESPDTCIKVEFDPRDNVDNVYKKFQRVAKEAVEADTGFDNVARALMKMPGPILRFAVACLRSLDYVGLLPQFLQNVSPFHGSMIITSMGSLGIPAIYHHLYNFGNLPVFLSYGSIFSGEVTKRDGTKERHHFVTFKVVTDERICDGYYYASAFKKIKRYILHPEMLENILDSVTEDVD